MQPALFDSSIYIAALRRGDQAVLTHRRMAANAPLWLSSVVLYELYMGAGDRERRVIERLESDFDRVNRLLVPSAGDWSVAGKILARLAAKYGHEEIGLGRLSNDALIAMSAVRFGIRVITTNARDFERLAEFRSFHWEVAGT